MDTISHGLAGALLARAAAREDTAPVVALAAAAAMFPDADAFFLPGSWFSWRNTLAYLEYHRSYTHSFLLAPVFALALAAMAKCFFRRVSWRRLWLFSLGAIVSHILLDWITSYGTMFLAPASWKRFSLDWVFILDPFFTGILALSLLLTLLSRRSRPREVAAAGSLIFVGYIVFCAVEHGRALDAARRMFHADVPASCAALPQPFSPFRWELFAERGESIDVAYVDIGPLAAGVARPMAPAGQSISQLVRRLKDFYPSPAEAKPRSHPTGMGSFAVAAARNFSDVAAWYRFARFPAVDLSADGDGTTRVTLTDLRFSAPWGRTAFVYEAIVSSDGREIASGFVRFPAAPAHSRR